MTVGYVSRAVFAFGIDDEEKVSGVRALLAEGWEIVPGDGGKCAVVAAWEKEEEANSALSEMLEVYKDYAPDGDVVDLRKEVEEILEEAIEDGAMEKAAEKMCESVERDVGCIMCCTACLTCGGRCCEIY